MGTISGVITARCKVCGSRVAWHMDDQPFVNGEIIGTCSDCLERKDHDIVDEFMVAGQQIIGRKEFSHNQQLNNGTIGSLIGYKVIEDNSIMELRLPKQVIEFLQSIDDFVKADDYGDINNQQPGDKPNIQGVGGHTEIPSSRGKEVRTGLEGDGKPSKRPTVDNQEKPGDGNANCQEGNCDVSSIPDFNIREEIAKRGLAIVLDDYLRGRYITDKYFETREILADKECMESIRKSMKQLKMGQGIPLCELYNDIETDNSEERNPAHYCMGFNCQKYLGHRGFCSDKCHNEFYG